MCFFFLYSLPLHGPSASLCANLFIDMSSVAALPGQRRRVRLRARRGPTPTAILDAFAGRYPQHTAMRTQDGSIDDSRMRRLQSSLCYPSLCVVAAAAQVSTATRRSISAVGAEKQKVFILPSGPFHYHGPPWHKSSATAPVSPKALGARCHPDR